MRPSHTRYDRPDRGNVDTMLGSKTSEHLSVGSAHLLDVTFCELRAWVGFSDAVRTVPHIVCRILYACGPAKILGAIVGSVTVLVRDFMQDRRSIAVERSRDERMHLRALDRTITPDVDLRVSVFTERLRKYLPRIGAWPSGYTAHPTKGRNLVIWRAGDNLPSLLFHGALDTRNQLKCKESLMVHRAFIAGGWA